ncbi:MAG: N-acetylmuramoyl-L-alanine amidase [Oscillospiraceae bacterium]|nr:N-acetylmuramoyl-L-alanine amidase [Oscillospiraceae bacterium]
MKRKFSRLPGLVTALAMVAGLCAEILSVPVLAEYDHKYDPGEIEVIVPQPEINRDEELPSFTEPDFTPMYSFPEQMRGVYVTPGVDFGAVTADADTETTDAELEAAVAESVEAMLDTAEANRLNSIIIRTDRNGEAFYSSDPNETVERSLIEYAIDGAKERGFYVYLNFSLDFVLGQLEDMELQSRIDRLAIIVHSFTVKYPVDGIILDGYYSSKNNTALNDYMHNGSGIGYDNWLLDNGAYVFSLAADAVRRTNNTVPVGISLNDVWANYTTEESGSETSVNFEALTDGYADTVSYIENGYADFIMLKAEGSLSDSSLPFNEIVGWWDGYAQKADIPLYVRHINEQICTDAQGWGSPDELVKQVIAASDHDSYKGSAFNSLRSLKKDTMSSTTALMKHYDDTIDLEGLNSELEMTLPKKTTFKTEEPTVIFAGSFDPNFPVYYQGKEIVLNEAGRFYFTEDLDVGVNTFKFQNKAKVITYKITRTVNVLKSVSPTDDTMRVEEQSTIALSAIAYKGSIVTAKVNGKSVSLKEVDGQLDELDPNSNYTKYIGYYTAPNGKKGQDIDLGNVEFYGTYPTKTGDISETRTGSRIIVNALAEVMNDYSGNLLRVNNDNTMVYNYKSTTTDPSPDCARLPAGTLDYIVKTVTYSGSNYYLTNSGKRILTSAVTVLDNKPLGSNPMSVVAAGKDGRDTVIKLKTAEKIPFSISYGGVSYSSGYNGNYYVSGFDPGYITVTFDYVTSVSSGDIKFPDSAVFTSGKWSTSESGDMKQAKLTLSLRQSGIYNGVTATYDSSDNLVLRFNGCENSVNGATIVIDPGHGYTGASEFDPGAIGHIKEQEANLAIAKYVEQMLSDAGANVIRLKTESQTYVTRERAATARQYSPDLFISVHCNAAGASAYGAEAYYFTPFSQPLAKYVSAELGSYLNEVHGSSSGNDRGAKYNYFWVTQQQDFPSILIETAFVTNYTEAMALANSSCQKKFASAIVNGIKKYFARAGYSCYGDGDAVWTNTDGSAGSPQDDYPPADSFTPSDTETTDPWENDSYYANDGYGNTDNSGSDTSQEPPFNPDDFWSSYDPEDPLAFFQ